MADRASVAAGARRGAVLLAGGAALVLAGLAVASPLLGQLAATLAARFERGLPVLLAARRLQADPAAAARVVTAGALLVAPSTRPHSTGRCGDKREPPH